MANIQFDSLLIESISLSLAHFLWQACVVASVAAIGFACLRRSPNARYFWGVACFAAFVACPIATFFWLQPKTDFPSATTKTDVLLAAINVIPVYDSVDEVPEHAEVADAVPFDRWQCGHLLVVVCWLLGQCFVSSRLLVSGFYVFHLKRTSIPVSPELRRIAERLSKRMGVRCPVVASAEHLCGAIAAGFFRQIIVIPTCWLTEMTPDMLSAVIAHEMAHLRRHDLWINLVQRIVESVLFFHPAVWWLSKRIRQDREICCDLLAIKATNQRKHYAETLEHVARLESFRSELLVTQMGEDRMSLLRRVRFVLGQQPETSSLGWWPAGVLAIVIPCGVVWMNHAPPAFAEEQEPSERNELVEPSLVPPPEDRPLIPPVQYDGATRLPIPPLVDFNTVDQILRANADKRPQTACERTLGKYLIESPDTVNISVENLAERKEDQTSKKPTEGSAFVSGEHLVHPDGTVNLGIYGRVYIEGMTIEKATEAVRERLAKYVKEPEVAMFVQMNQSKFFYVILEGIDLGDQVVRFPVTGNETVVDGVAALGRIEGLGKMKMHIKRPSPDGSECDQVLPIDWKAITRGRKTTTNYQMLPNDRLFVTRTENEDVGYSPLSLLGSAIESPNSVDSMPVGETLPSPYYDYGDIQIYPSGPEFVLQNERDQQLKERQLIIGPKTILASANARDVGPPKDAEIFRQLRTVADLPDNRENLSIKKQLIAEYTDEPKLYPHGGQARLHHAHYKCTIELDADDKSDSSNTFFVDHQHLCVVNDAAAKQAMDKPTRKGGVEEPYVTSYLVSDLVVPLRKPRFSKSGALVRVENAKPDFETLIDLITNSILPSTWEEVGGAGKIQAFAGNLSLVISQTQDAHDEIADLLMQLRALQESRVMLRATDLKLTTRLTKELGIHGKPLSLLTADEKQKILSASRRDAKARTFGDLKATLFNGQFMTMPIDDQSLTIQPVVLGGNNVRVVAAIEDLDQSIAATVTKKQSLLVQMQATGKDDRLQLFRLITAEVLDAPEKEERVLPGRYNRSDSIEGASTTKLGEETVRMMQRFPDGFRRF